jgi:hypothetical protein
VCVCVCVCVWYRDKKERWEEEGRGKEWEERSICNMYVYVCMYIRTYIFILRRNSSYVCIMSCIYLSTYVIYMYI